MNPRHFFLFLIGSFLSLYLVFSSTVTVPYVRHDSIRYFHKFYNKADDAPTNPLYEWDKALGRPLLAQIEACLYTKINHLSDMSHLRLIIIAIFALCSALLANIIVAQGLGAAEAFCMSVAIFTLPGIQECIYVPFLPLALPILLSISAYAIWASRLIPWIRLPLTFILLETAFFTYPPSTFFLLIPTAFLIILQDKDWKDTRKIWVRDIVLWGLGAVIYYLSLKIFFYPNLKLSGHEINFSWGPVLLNIGTFLSKGVPQSFNLWNIYYSKTLGITLMVFTASVLAIDYWIHKKDRGQRILAILGVFLVLNLIWFQFGGFLSRTFVASQAVVLILLYWCGKWIRNKWNKNDKLFAMYWSILLMLIGLVNANTTTMRNVLNSNSELMFFRSRLVAYADSSTTEIHIIRPKDTTRGYNGLPCVYDNFNCISLDDYEIPDLIRVAIKDVSDPPIEMHCIITSSNYNDPLVLSPHMLIINMNDLVAISKTS